MRGYGKRERVVDNVLRLLLKVDKPVTATEVSEKFGISYFTATLWLMELALKGYVKVVRTGYYRLFLANKEKILQDVAFDEDLITKEL